MDIDTLPAPVRAYLDAANAFDTDGVVAAFAADALVNDARREFAGTAAIRGWVERELVGDKVTAAPTRVRDLHGTLAVDAVMDGTYDKTGLPDPLVLTHYFTVRGDRIVLLIIVLNQEAAG